MRKPIGVIVNMPTTAEGKEMLRAAIMEVNGQLIAAGLRRVDASKEEKLAYIKSLNGVVPWAGKGL